MQRKRFKMINNVYKKHKGFGICKLRFLGIAFPIHDE